MPRRYLLSIGAGGIRGIIPTVALVKLENLTGKLTRDIFSFVAGTSTGAILSGTDAQFRIGSHNTLGEQYKVQVA
jgi:patatin-like phospholipase/acyl hydrolase